MTIFITYMDIFHIGIFILCNSLRTSTTVTMRIGWSQVVSSTTLGVSTIPTGVNSPYLNYGNNNHNVACRVESGGNVYGWIIGESYG